MDFIFDPSLVLYLPLYELDGASFTSRDAYAHLCTAIGAVWKPNGRYFDGADDYIDCGSNGALDFTSEDFTIESWINIDSLAASRTIVCRGSYEVEGYELMVPTNGRIYVSTWQSGARQNSYTATSVIGINMWYHIVWVRQGTSGVAYRNSELIDWESAPTHSHPATSARDFKVGIRDDNGQDFSGFIDEVRVYNRGLSPQEIQRNYLATKWRYR